jgi:hypothetical protein
MRRLIVSIAFVLVLVGCGKKELDRETASKVLQGMVFGSVRGSFSITPPGQFTGSNGVVDGSQQKEFDALTHLEKMGVIVCTGTFECRPGPNGSALKDENEFSYSYNAGTFVFGGIERIQQQTPTAAMAVVRFEFRPSPFYAQNKNLLDGLDPGFSHKFEPTLAQSTAPRIEEVPFVLFDDGWRLR